MPLAPDAMGDTIVACATPPGEGALAIVRLSGPRAQAIAGLLTRQPPPRRAHALRPARLHDAGGGVVDHALVAHMPAPRSYTGEDVVELYTHGSRVVVAAVLEASVAQGARLARPGEFTLRAFLNGRLDLTQAEAVADLVSSRSEAQAKLAAAALGGALTRAVEAALEPVEDVLVGWQASTDFPDDVDLDVSQSDMDKLHGALDSVRRLLAGARVEVRRSARVVLCGAPNVGKSTLLNCWAGCERVLVDTAPGTTRDPVELELGDGAGRWAVCDTAGIRDGAGGLEGRGIEMSREWMRRADVALWLLAADEPVWPPPEIEVSVAGSKADLADLARRAELEDGARARGLGWLGWVAPRTGDGADELRRRVLERLSPELDASEAVVTRQRQVEALRRCERALARVLRGHEERATLDVLCIELEEGGRALGELLGRDVDEAVLERIFSELCIGK